MEPPLTGVDMQVLAVPAEILTARQQLSGLPALCAGPLIDPKGRVQKFLLNRFVE